MRDTSTLAKKEDTSYRDDQYALILLDKKASVRYRLFPTASPEETASSISSFLYHKEDLHEDEQATAAYFLTKAAAFWGIDASKDLYEIASDSEYTNIKESKPVKDTYQKKASYEFQNFALGDKYPIDTPELVKEASVYFDKYASEFTPRERLIYAKNVYERAEELNVEPGSMIEKYAYARFDKINARREVLKRIDKAASALDKDKYRILLDRMDDLDKDQFMDLLGKLDKKAGLDRYYFQAFGDPLHSTIGKAAINVGEHNGSPVTDFDIKNIAGPNSWVSKYYGDTLADTLHKHPEMVNQLPDNDKELIFMKAKEG